MIRDFFQRSAEPQASGMIDYRTWRAKQRDCGGICESSMEKMYMVLRDDPHFHLGSEKLKDRTDMYTVDWSASG